MRPVANLFARVGLALGIVTSVLANDVQCASAAPQINSASQPSLQKSGVEPRSAPAKKQPRAKAIIALPRAVPAGQAPLFLSEEYLEKEKLTEDRLKRAMTICKGC